MSGGFYLVEYMEELEELFENGKKIVYYPSPEDLAKKIKYYLTNDSERKKYGKQGMSAVCVTIPGINALKRYLRKWVWFDYEHKKTKGHCAFAGL